MSARFSLAALLLLALASCNAGDRSANDIADRREGNLVAAATPSARPPAKVEAQPASARLDELDAADTKAAPVDPNAVTRTWFAGRWTDTEDCADAATFAANGTYLLADGTRGMWNVQDSRLVVQNAGGRTAVRLRKVAEDQVETVSDDGGTGRSTRC